jgi:nicotinamidase-related amidase
VLPTALLTMELQRGVVGDLAAFPALADEVARKGVVETTRRLLEAGRRAGAVVVHCTAEFRADRLGTAANTPLHAGVLKRPDHMLSGSGGTEIVPGLFEPGRDLVSSRLHGVSPFTGTSLDAMLRAMQVRTVVATGVSLNVAVVGLCIEAVGLGYAVVVARDAVAGVPATYAQEVLEHSLANIAVITTAAELEAALGGLEQR